MLWVFELNIMKDNEDVSEINEKELMEFYNYKGSFGRFKFRLKFLRWWILHSLAYSSPHPGFAIKMQRSRGVKIGKHCYLGPYVMIDLIYPTMVQIEDNVTIGSHVTIYAHANPTANLFLKRGAYPRRVEPVLIKKGAVINPGSIITSGVTIGENSIISVGSVVTQSIPDYCVVVGNPARVVKKIEH